MNKTCVKQGASTKEIPPSRKVNSKPGTSTQETSPKSLLRKEHGGDLDGSVHLGHFATGRTRNSTYPMSLQEERQQRIASQDVPRRKLPGNVKKDNCKGNSNQETPLKKLAPKKRNRYFQPRAPPRRIWAMKKNACNFHPQLINFHPIFFAKSPNKTSSPPCTGPTLPTSAYTTPLQKRNSKQYIQDFHLGLATPPLQAKEPSTLDLRSTTASSLRRSRFKTPKVSNHASIYSQTNCRTVRTPCAQVGLQIC